MKLFGQEVNFFGTKAVADRSKVLGDVSINQNDYPIMKAYIPEWLYKPPFGYPRKENLPLIRQLARNPYVYSVVRTLCDEAASTDYDIVPKNGVDMTPQLEEYKRQIKVFLDNPNDNKESFQFLIRAAVKDICEVDSGVWVKVFNQKSEFCQMYARDGGSFLKNPDIYGYLGNRAEFVPQMSINYLHNNYYSDMRNSEAGQKQDSQAMPDQEQMRVHEMYSMTYKEQAAYFQYGNVAMALPVPFGRREVIYMQANPRSDSVYGLSPIQILADIVTNLVHGSLYSLDFFMNNNMPEGALTMLGADDDQIQAMRQRMDNQSRVKDEVTGFTRKTGFKIPIYNQEMKFTPFQLEPKAMQIIEQQQWFIKIIWACFGVTADEMGFTEDSNRATGQNQMQVYKRKAVKPLLALLKYHIDKEIIAEWGDEVYESLEFRWDDYDLDEDIKKHSLYQMQLNMGISTPELIAEEEGIDYGKLESYQEEKHEREMDKMKAQFSFNNENSFNPKDDIDKKSFDNDLEKEMVVEIRRRSREIMKSLDTLKGGDIDRIK